MKTQRFKFKHNLKRILKYILPIKLWLFLQTIHTHVNAAVKRQQIIALIPSLLPLESKHFPQYIVSLTSYGKRLTDTAPFAIITILHQTVKPDKIVLWVANEDKENIPHVMKKLTEKGLEIRFCKDIKSYKKLIPALDSFPEDYIITADDDIFYPQNWFEQLVVEHKNNPHKIICHRAHRIKVGEDHNPIPYNKWIHNINQNNYSASTSQKQSVTPCRFENVFPTGGAGILYPPKCFHKDIKNEELFMGLAPYADDIWFWAMAIINKEYFGGESPYIVVENGYSQNLSLINPKQEKSKNTLISYNLAQNGNDKQLKMVIERYPQIRDALKKLNTVDSFI